MVMVNSNHYGSCLDVLDVILFLRQASVPPAPVGLRQGALSPVESSSSHAAHQV